MFSTERWDGGLKYTLKKKNRWFKLQIINLCENNMSGESTLKNP